MSPPPTSTKAKEPRWQARRKTVSSADMSSPRLPQRAPGKKKYAKLVDAVDRLLDEREASQISLYDVAEAAGVPAASVYHFFPSVSAAFVALANRHLQEFSKILLQPLDHSTLRGWQHVSEIQAGRIRQFYQMHSAALKLFLGPENSWQIRQADIQSNRRYAEIIQRTYCQHFVIAPSEKLIDRIEIAVAANDAVWALSVNKFGHITDEMADEALRVYSSYLRAYLPEVAERRLVPLDPGSE